MNAYDYSKINSDIIRELCAIVGERHVLTDPEKMEQYSHDETDEAAYSTMPEVVVKPRTAEEIAAIVRLANERKFPVTPRAAGSGLSGGAIPVYGGVDPNNILNPGKIFDI